MTMVPRLFPAFLRLFPLAGSLGIVVLGACTPPPRHMGPRPDFMADLEEKRFISAPGVAGVEGFSQAIKIGKSIYLSGQVPLDSAGRLVGGDLKSYLDAHVAKGFGDMMISIVGLLMAFWLVRFLYKRKIFLRI